MNNLISANESALEKTISEVDDSSSHDKSSATTLTDEITLDFNNNVINNNNNMLIEPPTEVKAIPFDGSAYITWKQPNNVFIYILINIIL